MNAKLVVAILVVVGAVSATASADSVGCIICKKLAGVIKPYLQDPQVAQAIAAGIEQACSQAQPDDRSQCKAALNKIVDTLRDGSPQEFCSFLNVCPVKLSANKPSIDLQQLMATFGSSPTSAGRVGCMICQKAAGIIKPYLQDPQVADAIAAGIQQACSLAPDQNQCTAFMNKLVKELRDGSPQEFCRSAGFC